MEKGSGRLQRRTIPVLVTWPGQFLRIRMNVIVKFSASMIFAAVLLSLSGCNATMAGAVGNAMTQAVNASMNGGALISAHGESRPIKSVAGLRLGYASGTMASPNRAVDLDMLAVKVGALRMVVQLRRMDIKDPSVQRPARAIEADLRREVSMLETAQGRLHNEIEAQNRQFSGEDMTGYRRLAAQAMLDQALKLTSWPKASNCELRSRPRLVRLTQSKRADPAPGNHAEFLLIF